jgi:uncharacterized membrane protein
MTHRVRRYIVAGLLVWLPLAITIWVLLWLLGLMDGVFSWLLTIGQHVLPIGADASIEALRRVPFLGVVVMAFLLLWPPGCSSPTSSASGGSGNGTACCQRIPIVKSIYNSVKQVSDTLFSSSGNAFREAVLVQYPHQGSWTIAFVTGKPGGEVAAKLTASMSACTCRPRPTRPGLLPDDAARHVRPLQMSVDEALKYIISMGVVAPPPPAPPRPLPAAAAPRN